MLKPTLSIIIISYNTSKITLDCLKSVFLDVGLQFELTHSNDPKIPTEIIIVDNNSSDDSVKNLKLIKNITLIVNKNNSGFGKANNQAAAAAKGNYLLFLNSDTIILHSAISQSLNWLSSHPEAGACTAQLLNKDYTIQASGGYFPNLLNIKTWTFNLDDLPFVNFFIKPFHPHTPDFYTHDNFYLNDHRQDWITGAYMLIRRSVFDAVNGFDENYFMYGEECEMLYRIHNKFPNYQTWYLVGPQVIHLGNASATKKVDPLIKEYEGVVSFFTKHKPAWQINIVKILLRINAISHRFLYFLTGNYQKNLLYKELCSRTLNY